MSDPRQSCQLCGNVVEVDFYARGFPPDSAKRKLKKLCQSQGCVCDPKYTAGFDEKHFAALFSVKVIPADHDEREEEV